MATHSSILGWRIPWTEGGAWWATVYGVAESDRTEQLTFSFSVHIKRKNTQVSSLKELFVSWEAVMITAQCRNLT